MLPAMESESEGNMMVGRNSDIKEIVKWIQEHVYAMLCDIDDFCKKNNITYSNFPHRMVC